MWIVHALVPVKRLGIAKSRLAPLLTLDERKGFSLKVLEHVLLAIQGAGISPCWVVGDDADVERVIASLGYDCLPEEGEDLNSTLYKAINRVAGQGAEGVLILPSDLPLLEPEDVEALAKAVGPRTGVVASDRAGKGTNAIGFPTGVDFTPRFGRDSFFLHCASLRERGLGVSILHLPRVAFDVDTPEDLEELIRLVHRHPHLRGFLPPRLIR